MEPQKSILIVGKAGSGKTQRSKEEAEKRGGHYKVAYWDQLKTCFGLGGVLRGDPQTVIVDEFDPKGDDWALVKALICGDLLTAEEMYKEPRYVVPPLFIFIASEVPKTVLTGGQYSRFEVIQL